MPRILIADDEVLLVRLFAFLFQSEGFTVSTATTGSELVQQAMAHPPDIILTDVEMPESNGITATRLLRTNPRTATLPIIVQSADPLYQRDAREAGASAFLVKPVMLDDLLATVRTLLAKQEAAACAP